MVHDNGRGRFFDLSRETERLLLLTGMGTVAGFLGRWWFVFDLASHFRVQYLVALLLCSIHFGWTGRRRHLLVALLLAVANGYEIAPLYMSPASLRASSGKSVTLLVVNLNSSNDQYERVARYLADTRPDVLVLQELTPAAVEAFALIKESYPYGVTQAQDDNFGIALWSRLPLSSCRVRFLSPVRIPCVTAAMATEKGSVTIMAIHPPPPIRPWFAELREAHFEGLAALRMRERGSFILAGDFNCSSFSPHFHSLLASANLVDTRRGQGIRPTWPANNPFFWLPIDHVLTSDDLTVTGFEVGPSVGSDHYPLLVTLSLPP